jgi:tetratricopeptide (TPR) repeat protein
LSFANNEADSPTGADWLHAPWMTPPSSADADQRARHDAAVALLCEHHATCRPFALFLRCFRIRQLYGQAPDGYGAFLMEVHLHRWLRKRGAALVRIQDASDKVSSTVDRLWDKEVPALLLDNSIWLSAVKVLISASQLIVSECEGLTPGVVDELRACVELGRADRTVLILPSPPHKFVGNEKDVQGFPRAMHQLELDPKCPARSVVFRDLICRMGRIAKLDPADRVRLTRSGELDKAMPISFRGVATGLFRIAAQYAREKNVGATYFAGSRAAEVAQAGCRIQQHMQYLLRLGDLCDEAGNTKLALTMLDDVTKAMESNGDELSAKSKEQVLAASRRRRIKWLGFLFESLMTPEHAQELWTLAKSQGGYAIGRRDRKVTAQCFSWMAVAAVLGGEYELAKEHAHDAISLAEATNIYEIPKEYAGEGLTFAKVTKAPPDRLRLAFCYLYLGHADRGLGQIRDAAENYGKAIKLLPKRPIRSLHALAMLSMGQAAEELGKREQALQLYRSTEVLGKSTGRSDLENAAVEGIKRLSK